MITTKRGNHLTSRSMLPQDSTSSKYNRLFALWKLVLVDGYSSASLTQKIKNGRSTGIEPATRCRLRIRCNVRQKIRQNALLHTTCAYVLQEGQCYKRYLVSLRSAGHPTQDRTSSNGRQQLRQGHPACSTVVPCTTLPVASGAVA